MKNDEEALVVVEQKVAESLSSKISAAKNVPMTAVKRLEDIVSTNMV